jgi:hypothetical protein
MKIHWKDIIVELFFVVITLFIFSPYVLHHQVPFPANLLTSTYEPWKSYPVSEYPNGAPNKPMGFDNLRIYYPLKSLAIDQIKHFQLPLWNPNAFSGNTLLGTYQSAIFHPLSWLFLLIPQIDAWSIIIMLQPILTATFMYMFLRSLSLSRRSSVFGSLGFAFSNFLIVWWEESFMSGYGAMALPLLLLGIELIRQNHIRKGFIVIVGGVVWCIVSGWVQMSVYVSVFVTIWTLYRLYDKSISYKKVGLIFFAVCIGILISGVQLIPGLEAYIYSARGTTTAKYLFDSYLLKWPYISTLLAPDFFGNPATYNYFGQGFYYEQIAYIGLIPLIFVLYSLFTRKKEIKESFWLISTIVFLSLGFSLPTSWLFYNLHIPLLSVMIPSRIFFLSLFSSCVLSAYCMDALFKNISVKRITLIIFVCMISFGVLWTYVLWQKKLDPGGWIAQISYRNLILPTGIFIVSTILLYFMVFMPKKRGALIWVIIFLSLFQSLYFAKKYLYFSETRFVYPENPVITKLQSLVKFDRVWSYGSGYMESNFGTETRLQVPDGYDSFFISRYGELMNAAANNGKINGQIHRADAGIDSVNRIDRILTSPARAKMLSLLGVKYIFGDTKKPEHVDEVMVPPKELQQLWTDDKFSIYQYTDSFPRTFVVSDYQVATSNNDILNKMFSPDIDLRKTVIL